MELKLNKTLARKHLFSIFKKKMVTTMMITIMIKFTAISNRSTTKYEIHVYHSDIIIIELPKRILLFFLNLNFFSVGGTIEE